jgi:hypothetical protein
MIKQSEKKGNAEKEITNGKEWKERRSKQINGRIEEGNEDGNKKEREERKEGNMLCVKS